MDDKNLPYRNAVRVFKLDITCSVYVQWQGFSNYNKETSGPLKAGRLLLRDLIEFTQHTRGTRC
jgi:hypothetical protein